MTDFSLKNCIRTAIEQNVALKQVKNNLESGQLQSRQADFNRFPNANANAGQNINFGRSIDPGSNQFITQDIWSNNFAISSTLTIYQAGRLRNLYLAGKMQVDAFKEDYNEQKITIILNVVNAYLQLIFNREILKVSTLQTGATENEVFRLEKLVKNGSVPEAQLLEMKARLMAELSTKIQNENQLELAKISLLQILNISTDKNQLNELNPILLDTFVLNNISSLVDTNDIKFIENVDSQPIVKAGIIRVNVADKNYAAARSALYPRITMSASITSLYSNARKQITDFTTQGDRVVGFLTSDPSQTVSQPILIPISSTIPFSNQVKENASANLGVNLIVPLFNNNQARINTSLARIQLENQRLALKQAQQTARQRLELSRLNLRNAVFRKLATEASLKSSLEAFRIAEKRYINGASTLLEFNILSTNYYKAISDDIQARYDLILKKKILDFYENNEVDF